MRVLFTLRVKYILKLYVSWGPKNTVYYDTTGYCKLCKAFVVIVSFSKEKKKNPFIAPPKPFINNLERCDIIIKK